MPSGNSAPVPRIVFDLVERFERNRKSYKSHGYNETQVRREFIDPLFKALGWDIDNEQGYAEAYKDVIHEDAIHFEKGVGAPDYCFRIGGTRKFFLEAKKPAIDIKHDPSPAYQLRRYAWTTKLPLGVLTDFEEFAVYDCRVKPDQKDKASVARILYIPFTEYAARWEEIAGVFSRDAVLKGSFDKYAEENKAKRGTADVDDDFLKTLETWRKQLAENLALRNKKLTQRELNFAVQRIIDRVIFLRICEGRGIEDYGRLQKLAEETDIYQHLGEIFREADDRYNSGLFHFQAEAGRHEPPDELTLGLNLDDKLLRGILQGLYYPESPYVFSKLPADVLGHVYEQFLGKVIRLTEAHYAKVEDKPEVKKAGGVYYTPTYIVDYIVQNTVGKLLEGKTAKQAAKLRILDPACGSGSFLLGAYEYLLQWHLKWYSENEPKKWARGSNPALVQVSANESRLTIAERKRILLENIYGVDIDPQAVETTKLSLLLKVLEGETQQTLQPVLKTFQERALPDLGDNIKCGNSLIRPDFYEQQLLPLSEEQQYRVNVFDWEKEFFSIVKAGGFDAVIGNPPYLRIQGLQHYYSDQIEYFQARYASALKRFDLYMLFLERGFLLLAERGWLGFICPHKFTHADYASQLRLFLARQHAIKRLLSFGHNLVFKQATIYTGIVLLRKNDQSPFLYAEITDLPGPELPSAIRLYQHAAAFTEIDQSLLGALPWQLAASDDGKLLNKLRELPDSIGSIFSEVLVGVQSGIDDVHVLSETGRTQRGGPLFFSDKEQTDIEIEEDIAKPFALGDDVHRYAKIHPTHRCIYPYRVYKGKTEIIDEISFRAEYPLAYAYLHRHQSYLRQIRKRQKTNPLFWYSCHRSRDMRVFEQRRIVTPEISKGCSFTIADSGLYHNTQVYSLVPAPGREEHLLYWLGILNSKVLWWFLQKTGTVLRGGYFRFKTNYLRPFPIVTCDMSKHAERARHDHVVELVDRMLDLHERLRQAKAPQDKTSLERQIGATDAQINRIVYELYGLTSEEVQIVEGSKAPAAEEQELREQH